MAKLGVVVIDTFNWLNSLFASTDHVYLPFLSKLVRGLVI